MPDPQDNRDVVPGVVLIKRDIAGASARNHQFPQTMVSWPANLRVRSQQFQGCENHFACGGSCVRQGLKQKISQSIKIVDRFVGKNPGRHAGPRRA